MKASVKWTDGRQFVAEAGSGHSVVIDGPPDHGGRNTGPRPMEMLLMGLGACTSMTIRMYARRKGWPLTHVQVDVCHDKVHAQDADSAADAKIDVFRRRIRLSGDLDADQRAKLRDIADKCPVHRTLERSSTVETVLLDG